MKNATGLRPLAVATVTLGLLAGCGGGDDGSTPGTTTKLARGAITTTTVGRSDGSGYYVSLGDSYSVGAGASDVATGGYANLLPEAATAKGWDLELMNFGCGGATVESLKDGAGCSLSMNSPTAPDYGDETQLDAAVAFMEEHPGEIELVTVSIGGNNVTQCAGGVADPITCVTDAVTSIDKKLGPILERVREAAGPDATIVGLTYPDVILGAYLNEPTRQLAQLSVVAFKDLINPAFKKRYEAVDGIFVDVTEGTGAYTPLSETTTTDEHGEIPAAVAQVCELTWYCERMDIHPKDAGYERMTELIVQALPER